MMKWVLKQIFERVARDQNAILRVVFADRLHWQGHPGEPEVTILFWTQAAERCMRIAWYVGFFEAYSNGNIDLFRSAQCCARTAAPARSEIERVIADHARRKRPELASLRELINLWGAGSGSACTISHAAGAAR